MTDEGLDSRWLHPNRAGQGWAGLLAVTEPAASALLHPCPFAPSSDEWRGPEEGPEGVRDGLRAQNFGFQLWRFSVWLPPGPLGRVLRVGLGVEETALDPSCRR